jgi:hypothetical protein
MAQPLSYLQYYLGGNLSITEALPMDCTGDERTEQCERIESVIACGAIGGLIGMLLSPLATLVCAVVGAEIGRRFSGE